MIDGGETGERFSLVEHPMSPRALAAPLHLHTREDEYSFVLQGRMGALLGDDVVEGGPGDLVFKPRSPPPGSSAFSRSCRTWAARSTPTRKRSPS